MSTTNLNQIVAARIRAVMASQKLTAATVAESLGYSRYAMSSRLTGKVDFSLSDIDRFSKLTGYSPSDLTSEQFNLVTLSKAA